MRRTATNLVILALFSVAAFSGTLAATAGASAASNSSSPPTSKGSWKTGGPITFYTAGHVRITRLWDAWNNCVEQDGTQHHDLAVHAGENIKLGVTTVSSGWCAIERSKMHWKVTQLDAHGAPTSNTADIGLSQGDLHHVLDYSWECNKKDTGSMKCKQADFLGVLVGLSWTH
jgi:hypothetical protein